MKSCPTGDYSHWVRLKKENKDVDPTTNPKITNSGISQTKISSLLWLCVHIRLMPINEGKGLEKRKRSYDNIEDH